MQMKNFQNATGNAVAPEHDFNENNQVLLAFGTYPISGFPVPYDLGDVYLYLSDSRVERLEWNGMPIG